MYTHEGVNTFLQQRVRRHVRLAIIKSHSDSNSYGKVGTAGSRVVTAGNDAVAGMW